MQVIVTSYQRPLYLRQCVESLRQDDIELYIIDGGSDDATKAYIEQVSNGHLFFEGNPGADHLKTEGIKAFATRREFMISSDDLQYPKGYSRMIYEQYMLLNRKGLQWSFVACNMPSIEANKDHKWKFVNGVEILPVGTSQVAGAIVDTALCKSVGYFPLYGKSGQGDWAFSKRLRMNGIKMGYLRRPIIVHLGDSKWQDYPEYSKQFRADEDRWMGEAQQDVHYRRR